MTLLARFLQLLQLLEGVLEYGDGLTTPLGQIASVGVGLYVGLMLLGSDASTAATLSGSVALVLSCILTRPQF